jgi:L-2-hydroxyglutarate oxidase
MEPKITGLGGIFVADSGIVDFTEVARVMGGEFARMGGKIRYDCAVTALEERRNEVVVHTAQGSFTTRYMVSCSGLMADRLIRMLGQNPGFTICPFRGEYFVLPTEHNQIVRHLIYPIPDPTMPFLGVHLTRMIDGSVTVGPNAVLALKREGYRKRDVSLGDMAEMFTNVGILKVLRKNLRFGLTEMKNSFLRRGYLEAVRKYCPSITLADLHPYPSGVRAQAVLPDGTLMDDFLFVSTPRTVNVGNAPSPAATASIPIGAHIVERVKEMTEG